MSDIWWRRAMVEWHPQRSADAWTDLSDRLRVLHLEHPDDDDLALLLALAASFAARAQLPLEAERLRRQVQALEALAEAAGDTTHQTLAADLLARLQPQP